MTELWSKVKSSLIKDTKIQAWLEHAYLMSVDVHNSVDRFCIGVPSDLHKKWISDNFLTPIQSEIANLYKKPFEVEIFVNKKQAESLLSWDNKAIEAEHKKALGESFLKNTNEDVHKTWSRPIGNLNPDQSFDTFIVGKESRFAHAASLNVCKNPGSEESNPLFICGATGLGKSHLINAIGNEINKINPELRIKYVSTEKFFNECISFIRRNKMDQFRKKYRDDCDVLLVDDIPLFGRGEAVQDAFFNILNHFFNAKKQVVVTSDRMPKDIKGMEDRIQTRLERGLIADIAPPDLETRIAILESKIEQRQLQIPKDVVRYIALVSRRSVRQLEGNLNLIKMFAELQGLEITMELAENKIPYEDQTCVSIEEIQKLVSDHFRIKVSNLVSKSRTRDLVRARQCAIYLIDKHLDCSLVDIGKAFGGRDHSTVINALQRLKKNLLKDVKLRSYIKELELKIDIMIRP